MLNFFAGDDTIASLAKSSMKKPLILFFHSFIPTWAHVNNTAWALLPSKKKQRVSCAFCEVP